MNAIRLHNQLNNFTIISNDFIKYHMPEANGEFIKVYLYILSCNGLDITISDIADTLNHTEKDVIRALRYWHERQLITLILDGNHIIEITLLAIPTPASDEIASHGNTVSDAQPISFDKPHYTPAQLKIFYEQEQLKQLLFITEKYIGKPLSQPDITTIIYFHDVLKFSIELIEYLIEYCVTNNHRSMRYIEKVALTWAEKEINTLEKARANAGIYHKNYFAVFKAFGLSNRSPGEIEIQFMKRWFDEYKFELNIVLEACNRTLQAIHQPSFDYVDSILKNWFEKKVRHLSDVQKLDEAYNQQKRKSNPHTDRAPSTTTPKSTKFSNFKQRSYDYKDIEKKLTSRRTTE